MGSDEAHISMKDFIPRMAEHIRGKGKEVVVWSPGGPHDKDSVLMCWGENEAGARMDKNMKRIDSNGFTLTGRIPSPACTRCFSSNPARCLKGMIRRWGPSCPCGATET